MTSATGSQQRDGPRVDRLRYVTRSKGAIMFRNVRLDEHRSVVPVRGGPPDPVVGGTDEFRITIEDGRATVELLADHSTVDGARVVVEPYLRAWEIEAFLNHVEKHGDFQQPLRFEFEGADVTNPVPGSAVVVLAQSAGAFFYRAYPPPPQRIVASSHVRLMWLRWQEYQAGREPLPSMAYFCLTTVEALGVPPDRGKRGRAAAHLGIARDVLDTLGDLVSEVGSERELRKAFAKRPRPYTSAERQWIEFVTLALIRRVGEAAKSAVSGPTPGPRLAQITMADFPRI